MTGATVIGRSQGAPELARAPRVPGPSLLDRVRRWARVGGVVWWPAYWTSGFVRRDPRLWVFGSQIGRAFRDNAKWFFLACASDPRVHAVWLSKSPAVVREVRSHGLEAHLLASPRGLWCALRAGTYLFDETPAALNVWLSRGTRMVNLWHGIPLKKIEADVPPTSRFYRRFSPRSLRGVLQRIFQPYDTVQLDHIVATSDRIGQILAGAFRTDPSRILVTGYPRNDSLFIGDAAADAALLPGGRRYSRVLGYFPTFRESAPTIRAGWRWRALDDALRARDALLVIKLHPQDTQGIDTTGMENLRVVRQGTDPYPMLPRLDALITDYSSIYFDYLLLDRPVLFFPYDLEHYEKDERGFYFEYDQVTPGPTARTFDDLVRRICELLDDYDGQRRAWRPERDRVAQLCHAFRDGDSARRLIDRLLEGTRADAREPVLRGSP